jgi:hypothetical protein
MASTSSASVRFSGPVRLVFGTAKNQFPGWNLFPGVSFISGIGEPWFMLVERGLKVMNVEVVGDAYAIASSYLRKTGAIADIIATHEPLLEIVVELFHRGECNRLRLANRAIARFEAEFV